MTLFLELKQAVGYPDSLFPYNLQKSIHGSDHGCLFPFQ